MQYQTIRSDFTTHKNNKLNQQTFQKDQYLQRRKSNMINHLLDTIEYQSNDKNQIKKSLLLADKQFQTIYARTTNSSPKNNITIREQIQRELYTQTQNNKHKLSFPKPNTLTDQFMKLTLGCEEELIESYNETVSPKKVIKINQQDKIKTARQYFLSYKNSYQRLEEQKQGKNRKHVNFFVNNGNNHPFYDQDYHRYLKTNALFLSNQKHRKHLKGNIISNQCASITTDDEQIKSQKIIQKLKQTGGIEDTIKIMEKSLNTNQIRHFKKNQYIKPINNNQHKIIHHIMNPENKLQGQSRCKVNHHKYKSTLTSNQQSRQKYQKKRSQSVAFIQIHQKNQQKCVNATIDNWKQRSKSLRQKLSKNLTNK